MSIRFYYDSGEEMPLFQGLPVKFPGIVLKGTRASYIQASFGEIVCQEFSTPFIHLRDISIHWKQPGKIVCKYDHPTGLHSRVSLNNTLHEYIKGAGITHLKKEQFSLLNGSSWTGLIMVQKTGEYHFIDLSWSADFLRSCFTDSFYGNEYPNDIVGGLPKREIGPPSFVNENMKKILAALPLQDFNHEAVTATLHNLFEAYLGMMMEVFKTYDAAKREMKEFDWIRIHAVKKLIDDNLHTQFTTPEISVQTGMNEFKLKRFFPKITGFKMEEYRKYQLCVKAGTKLLRISDVPVKHFFAESGYSTLQNFIRAFQKYCACSPGELRLDSWDVNNFSSPIENE